MTGLLFVRFFDFGSAQQIIDTDPVVVCQFVQRGYRDIQLAKLIVGIGRLVDLQMIRHCFLGEVVILPQISETVLVHIITLGYYAIREYPLLTFKGITLKILEGVIEMIDRLHQIYSQLWPEPSETELYIMELQETCDNLEQRLLDVAGQLPDDTGRLIESYICNRGELELYSITQAFKAGRKIIGQKES